MRFPMPHLPCEFEIPDDWLAEAGIVGFVPHHPCFRSSEGAMLVPLTQVEPPPRFATHPKDWRGFDRARFVSVLTGFVADEVITPVPVVQMPALELGHSPYAYRVLDGVHRFYASVAAGFTHLPVDL